MLLLGTFTLYPSSLEERKEKSSFDGSLSGLAGGLATAGRAREAPRPAAAGAAAGAAASPWGVHKDDGRLSRL